MTTPGHCINYFVKRLLEHATSCVSCEHAFQRIACLPSWRLYLYGYGRGIARAQPLCHETAVTEVSGPEQAEDAELEGLEVELTVNDILLFRTMAERQAQSRKAAGPSEQRPEEEEEVFQDATEVM